MKSQVIVDVCNARAALQDYSPLFQAIDVNLESDESIVDLLSGQAVDLVFVGASLHTLKRPGGQTAPSAWDELITDAGLGLTLPLQMRLTERVARARDVSGSGAAIVNGCLPDFVNALLAHQGRDVHCGIGNVATLESALRAHWTLPVTQDVRVLAHHAHLHTPPPGLPEVRAWVDGKERVDVAPCLAAIRRVPRGQLNGVAGHSAAVVLRALIRGDHLQVSLPGPCGLPGGYPVTIENGDVGLRLPSDLSPQEATSFNTQTGTGDGVWLDGGSVHHTERVVSLVSNLDHPIADYASGYLMSDVSIVGDHLIDLRNSMGGSDEIVR